MTSIEQLLKKYPDYYIAIEYKLLSSSRGNTEYLITLYDDERDRCSCHAPSLIEGLETLNETIFQLFREELEHDLPRRQGKLF